MRRAVDIGPTLLPWVRSGAEAHHGRTRAQIERALADLACGLWRAAGVTVPEPSRRGHALLLVGRAVYAVGLMCAICLVPLAIALVLLAVLDRPEDAAAALLATCVAAAGTLLVLAGTATIDHAGQMLLRLPPDIAPRHDTARNPHAGRAMQRVGVALGLGFALIVAMIGCLLFLRDPATPIRMPFISAVPALLVFAAALLLVGTLLIDAGIALFRRGSATLQLSADELMTTDRRRPVLLLRSFGDEQMSVAERPTWGQAASLARMEESIADQLRRFGPLIAIGKPGEVLPELGASRNYYSDEEWRAAALGLMQDALLIVVIAGITAGLRWELEAIARIGHQAKLLILMPQPQRRRRWETLIEEMRGVPGFDALPPDVPDGLLSVHAGPGVGCTLLSARQSGRIDYDAAIRYAIYGMLCASGDANVPAEAAADQAALAERVPCF
jgi:hypothetical protein